MGDGLARTGGETMFATPSGRLPRYLLPSSLTHLAVPLAAFLFDPRAELRCLQATAVVSLKRGQNPMEPLLVSAARCGRFVITEFTLIIPVRTYMLIFSRSGLTRVHVMTRRLACHRICSSNTIHLLHLHTKVWLPSVSHEYEVSSDGHWRCMTLSSLL